MNRRQRAVELAVAAIRRMNLDVRLALHKVDAPFIVKQHVAHGRGAAEQMRRKDEYLESLAKRAERKCK